MYTLSENQIKIRDFILQHPRCNIFAGCGVGKTLATLTALELLKERPILIVAPLRVANYGWEQQARQFGINLTFSKMVGSNAERLKAYDYVADVYIINYENLNWLNDNLAFKFKTVVCDEATKIKNHQTFRKNDKLIYRKGRNSTALVRHARHADRWINLTATPIHNHLKDFWGLQFPIDFGESLGFSRQVFLNKYFNAFRFKSHLPAVYTPKHSAKEEIIKKINPTCIWVKADSKNKTIIEDIEIELPPDILKIYKRFKNTKSFTTAKGDIIIDQTGMKQRQFTSGFLLNETGVAIQLNGIKKQYLLNLLSRLDGNIIIVYQFKEEARLLQELLPTSKRLDKDTEQTLTQWNSGQLKYLLIHPLSAGHGVNLQHGGNKMVFYSNDWDGELFSQTIERIGNSRQQLSGYNRNTYIYRFVTAGTIEDKIVKKIESKINNAL